MTAVEWFAKQMLEYKSPTNINGTDYILIPTNKIEFLQEQAKEMEKEQKIEFAKMHVKTALKAVENEMILHASSVKHWYLPQNIK